MWTLIKCDKSTVRELLTGHFPFGKILWVAGGLFRHGQIHQGRIRPQIPPIQILHHHHRISRILVLRLRTISPHYQKLVSWGIQSPISRPPSEGGMSLGGDCTTRNLRVGHPEAHSSPSLKAQHLLLPGYSMVNKKLARLISCLPYHSLSWSFSRSAAAVVGGGWLLVGLCFAGRDRAGWLISVVMAWRLSLLRRGWSGCRGGGELRIQGRAITQLSSHTGGASHGTSTPGRILGRCQESGGMTYIVRGRVASVAGWWNIRGLVIAWSSTSERILTSFSTHSYLLVDWFVRIVLFVLWLIHLLKKHRYNTPHFELKRLRSPS
jgi:hypothetical protein